VIVSLRGIGRAILVRIRVDPRIEDHVDVRIHREILSGSRADFETHGWRGTPVDEMMAVGRVSWEHCFFTMLLPTTVLIRFQASDMRAN
jgi:hypothetical protein